MTKNLWKIFGKKNFLSPKLTIADLLPTKLTIALPARAHYYSINHKPLLMPPMRSNAPLSRNLQKSLRKSFFSPDIFSSRILAYARCSLFFLDPYQKKSKERGARLFSLLDPGDGHRPCNPKKKCKNRLNFRRFHRSKFSGKSRRIPPDILLGSAFGM